MQTDSFVINQELYNALVHKVHEHPAQMKELFEDLLEEVGLGLLMEESLNDSENTPVPTERVMAKLRDDEDHDS